MAGEGLSAVLNSIKVSDTGLAVIDLLGSWSIEIDYPKPITVTVVQGQLWLKTEAGAIEVFEPGESFVLARGASLHRYVVSSSQSPPHPVSTKQLEDRFEPFLPERPDVSLRRLVWGPAGGQLTRLMSFTFDWQDRKLGPLIESIPEFIRIRQNASSSFLKEPLLGLFFDAEDAKLPGFKALIAQLAQLFLVQAIRSYALEEAAGRGGLLAALADPQLSRALSAIHNHPGQHWSVESLSNRAGMSRSLFACRFKEVTGLTPMAYLRSWRIHLARRALREGDTTVASISFDLGYQSEAAFRASFRQETGLSPREYARSVAATVFDPSHRETDQSF